VLGENSPSLEVRQVANHDQPQLRQVSYCHQIMIRGWTALDLNSFQHGAPLQVHENISWVQIIAPPQRVSNCRTAGDLWVDQPQPGGSRVAQLVEPALLKEKVTRAGPEGTYVFIYNGLTSTKPCTGGASLRSRILA